MSGGTRNSRNIVERLLYKFEKFNSLRVKLKRYSEPGNRIFGKVTRFLEFAPKKHLFFFFRFRGKF